MDETKTFYEMYELNIEEYENIDIDTIEFSVRVNNRLHRGNINTVGALLRCTKKDLAGLNGFGAGCFKEIHDFCSNLSSENKKTMHTSKKRVISENIYGQRHKLVRGDFYYVPVNDEEKECLLEYEEAFNNLGIDLVSSCIENPCYIIELEKILGQFTRSVLLVNEYINAIPNGRRKKKAKLLIDACTYTMVGREGLLNKLKDEEETVEN